MTNISDKVNPKILNCGVAFTTKDAEKREILSSGNDYDDRFYFYILFLVLIGSIFITISSLLVLKDWIMS